MESHGDILRDILAKINIILLNQESLLAQRDEMKQQEIIGDENVPYDLTGGVPQPETVFDMNAKYILKHIFSKAELNEMKGCDISQVLNYDGGGHKSQKRVISKACQRIRKIFYSDITKYENLTPDQVQALLGNEFEHIGEQFKIIFISPCAKIQGKVESAKFAAAFKRHFLTMIRG